MISLVQREYIGEILCGMFWKLSQNLLVIGFQSQNLFEVVFGSRPALTPAQLFVLNS